MRARWWSPRLGAFLSADQFGYADFRSTLWGWGNQSPLRWSDPTGHFITAAQAAAAGLPTGLAPEAAAGASFFSAGPLALIGVGAFSVVASAAIIVSELDELNHPTVNYGGQEPASQQGPVACTASSGGSSFGGGGGGGKPPAPPVATGGPDSPDGGGPDPNKLNHIFGNANHALDDLVAANGGQEQAFNAVQAAANAALEAGQLQIGPNGILPGGPNANIINVNGINVQLVGGRIVNGIVQIGSISRQYIP